MTPAEIDRQFRTTIDTILRVAAMPPERMPEFAGHSQPGVRVTAILNANRNDLPLFLGDTYPACAQALENRIKGRG